MKHIIAMWKRTFDYKGESSAAEFIVPFLFGAALTVIDIVFIAFQAFGLRALSYIIVPVTAYLVLSFAPFLSLTVRRLRNAGKSAWWCCLLFILGIGPVLLTVILAAGLNSFDPDSNVGSGVYGPPPPDFDVTENYDAGVYGPPPDFAYTETTPLTTEPPAYDTLSETAEITEETSVTPASLAETAAASVTAVTAVTSATSLTEPEETEPEPVLPVFEVSENIHTCVYGPPEWFGITEDEDDFEAEYNIEPDVYGPPEWFENRRNGDE